MKRYLVLVTEDAAQDLEAFVDYLLTEKKSAQAAAQLLEDYDETVAQLAVVAGSLQLCSDSRLKSRGYRRMQFMRHRYFMLYRIEGDSVIVDAIGHELQDIRGFLL